MTHLLACAHVGDSIASQSWIRDCALERLTAVDLTVPSSKSIRLGSLSALFPASLEWSGALCRAAGLKMVETQAFHGAVSGGAPRLCSFKMAQNAPLAARRVLQAPSSKRQAKYLPAAQSSGLSSSVQLGPSVDERQRGASQNGAVSTDAVELNTEVCSCFRSQFVTDRPTRFLVRDKLS